MCALFLEIDEDSNGFVTPTELYHFLKPIVMYEARTNWKEMYERAVKDAKKIDKKMKQREKAAAKKKKKTIRK